MATNYLDTGDTGRAVSAESDGALFAGIFGSAKYVLENGSQFKAEVQSNNIVKISDGDAVMYGRHVRIPANDSALVTINNGHAGTNRVDLIVFRYTKDSTGKETVDLVVIQGEDFTGTATAPTAVDGNILTGAMQSDFPLYTVELNGINIVKVNPLFNVIGNISKLKEELTELNSKITAMNNIIKNVEIKKTNLKVAANSDFRWTWDLPTIPGYYPLEVLAWNFHGDYDLWLNVSAAARYSTSNQFGIEGHNFGNGTATVTLFVHILYVKNGFCSYVKA
jgi:hypothetical protein